VEAIARHSDAIEKEKAEKNNIPLLGPGPGQALYIKEKRES